MSVLTLALVATFAGPVWIEAETPTSSNVKFEVGSPGNPEMLSGGQWLSYSTDNDRPVPGDLMQLAYEVDLPEGAKELWGRLGFWDARPTVRWRVDTGPWQEISPKTVGTDLTELAAWNQVDWIRFGSVALMPGKHRLELQMPRPKEGDGKPGRLLFGADAFVLSPGEFHPVGAQRTRPPEPKGLSFEIPLVENGQRKTVDLAGQWLIARDDEEKPSAVEVGMRPVSANPQWSAIAVPGDYKRLRPELSLSHRVWYRTTLRLGKSAAQSTLLRFRQNSLNTTVVVNGKECGFNPMPFVNWDCDISAALKEGDNDVRIGIRDAIYGYQDPASAWGLPRDFEHQGFQRLAYPIWGCWSSGLLATPKLVVAGSTYVSDVFVKPKVSEKALEAEVTLAGKDGATVIVEAVAASGEVTPITRKEVSARTTTTLRGAFPNAELWWPDRPTMYRLRTTVEVAGKPIDVCETPFGYREWTADGPNYRLNGVKWHGWAELIDGDSKEAWLKNYRESGQRFMRLMGPAQNGASIQWRGMPYDEALDWFDQNGVVVRRSGPLDGETIGYMAPDEKGGINRVLLENVRRQMVAQVRSERNHPSINVWSVENEWLYINCINLYGDLMDAFEADMKATMDAVAQVDPTRLSMTDGGGAGKRNQFPIHGDHYVYTNDPADYPGLAYTAQPNGGGRGRWVWNGQQPRYAGEDFYATGINPADYAWIQGETAFGGKVEAHEGIAKVQRMITEGYRTSGAFTAFHLWVGSEGSQFGKYKANAERAAFIRESDWTFGSGQRVPRTVTVLNDSRFDAPIRLEWVLSLPSGKVSGVEDLKVAPGEQVRHAIELKMPTVTNRTEGKLTVRLLVDGKVVFSDEKQLSVLPPPTLKVAQLGLFDPSGKIGPRLRAWKQEVVPVTDLGAIPATVKTLLVAPDALSASEATQPRLAAFAANGHSVVVLDQKNPLRSGGLPIPMDTKVGGSAFAFGEDSNSPVLEGLQDSDLVGWGSDEKVARSTYVKPEKGAKSLVQLGARLQETAVVEVPVGKGLLLLSQMTIGENLDHAAAQTLLANLLRRGATYAPVQKPVRVASTDPQFLRALNAMGVSASAGGDPLAALTPGAVAVVSATPANLRRLVENLPAVRKFTSEGGALVLNGLTPEGLAEYNRLVGVEHMIRPFRREKVGIRVPRDPLAQGIPSGDVVLYSAEKLFDWTNDMFVADDTFSYIVDVDDVAPFATFESDYHTNIVNGFVSADAWKYIFSFDLSRGAPKTTLRFPKPLSFRRMTWIGNGFYHKVKQFALRWDGAAPRTFDVAPNTEPQDLGIAPVSTGQSLDLEITDWTKNDGSTGEVVGIDNLALFVDRPVDWSLKVKPLLNVGGLVRYPQGRGQIVLANLRFQSNEAVPINAQKKRSVLAAILRNLGAKLGGSVEAIVPGTQGIEYRSIPLAGKANAFRDARGWFGDTQHTFADLPTGSQNFGGVPFDVYRFETSPVPTAILLGGPGVPGNLPDRVEGIPVGGRARSLFFLQTARLDRDSGEVARYVVHYANGSTVEVPILANRHVGSYRTSTPADLPEARCVWRKAYSDGDQAAAYLMQWVNPNPAVDIVSVDLLRGDNPAGVPALLAITAAR